MERPAKNLLAKFFGYSFNAFADFLFCLVDNIFVDNVFTNFFVDNIFDAFDAFGDFVFHSIKIETHGTILSYQRREELLEYLLEASE